MINIAAIHRRKASGKPLAEFFRSKGFRLSEEHLKELGVPEAQITMRTKSFKGNPAEARVHPLIAIEYLRWGGYDQYAVAVCKLLDNVANTPAKTEAA